MSAYDQFGVNMFSDKLIPVLNDLLRAAQYADDTNSKIWDFAIPIQRLYEQGSNETDLRWFVRKGLVSHEREVTNEGEQGRHFRPTGDLTFTRQTCFVLTPHGIEVAITLIERKFENEIVGVQTRAGLRHGLIGKTICRLPRWNPEVRLLHFDGQLVKRFKWPAVNQEAILCAFQEEGWPDRIDDPLPPQRQQDSKRRLADTIKCLNRKQINSLIHFRGDGTGEGVIWEQVRGEYSSSNALQVVRG